ncbi:MAG: phenylalanine--tRNA ligase subunit alpha [Legionellales bacterium]|nr:MAG: phenylalanine--tRNA ligase subunit alpha [Legionellales bacterium]
MHDIKELQDIALSKINAVADATALEQLRVTYLGKKGELTILLKQLKELAPIERGAVGKNLNIAKQTIIIAIKAKQQQFGSSKVTQQLQDNIDVTLPGHGLVAGSTHPITSTMDYIKQLFTQMGFAIAYGPEIEDEHYNFNALNIPDDHPARAMHDTFYFTDGSLLRTHTSPVQIRTMTNNKPPLQIISVGKVYRCDYDATHTPMFHQIEGFLVAEGITFAHLKGVINGFLTKFFHADIKTRFRPSYFPFTEPSAEVDVQCVKCSGSGCNVCKDTGWLEVLGCGMVHPKVLENCNIDSKKYTGFAFGMGIERLAMLRYGIHDLRLFFANDMKFLGQFAQ